MVGGGADGGQPPALVVAVLDQGLYVAVALEHLHAPQTAGEHQHVHRLPVQLGQRQVGGDSDAVGAGDGGAVHAHQSDLNARPAQQIGGHQGLALLKSGSQQNRYHVKQHLSFLFFYPKIRAATAQMSR